MKAAILAAMLAATTSVTLAEPGPYSVSGLPTPLGGSSDAFHISDAGVSGYVDGPDGLTYVLRSESGVQAFTTFGTFSSIGISSSNNNGVVVGGGYGARQPPQAIVWVNGVGSSLPNSDSDADDTDFLYGSTARAVNDGGAIVGYGDTQYGANGIVWHTNGDVEILHSQNTSGPEYAAAHDINNAGVVAGLAVVGDLRHAVTWQDGVLTDLGIFAGGTLASANAINDAGQVVGWGDTGPDGGTAFISDGTSDSMVALPNVGGLEYGEAFDINNNGWAVGTCIPSGLTGHGIATLWVDGVGYDLNDLIAADSGWELISATGISDDGVIVGQGIYDGQYLAYQISVVPSPAAFSCFAVGALPMARRRRR